MDPRGRYDLLCAWLYKEYAEAEAEATAVPGSALDLSIYDACLVNILAGLQDRLDPKDK